MLASPQLTYQHDSGSPPATEEISPCAGDATVGALFVSGPLLVGAHISGAYYVALTLWGADSQKHSVCTQRAFRESALFPVFSKMMPINNIVPSTPRGAARHLLAQNMHLYRGTTRACHVTVSSPSLLSCTPLEVILRYG